jgi:hypothetical protein
MVTITVSGHAPIPALALFDNGRFRQATSAGSADALAFLARERQVFTSPMGTPATYARCQSCRAWRPRAELRGAAIGLLDQYCATCLEAFQASCRMPAKAVGRRRPAAASGAGLRSVGV